MYEERPSASPLINCVWRAVVDTDGAVIDQANEYWGLAFTRAPDGRLSGELIGPSLAPRVVEYVAGYTHWGAELHAHVFVRGVHKSDILGSIISLPVDEDWFELARVRYRVPDHAGLEDLVRMLHAQGVLRSDPAVARAMSGPAPEWSTRSLQRRFRRTTAMTRTQIEQIERVRTAYVLIAQGHSLAEAATESGYADQAHMTRAFRLLTAQTPARILAGPLVERPPRVLPAH